MMGQPYGYVTNANIPIGIKSVQTDERKLPLIRNK